MKFNTKFTFKVKYRLQWLSLVFESTQPLNWVIRRSTKMWHSSMNMLCSRVEKLFDGLLFCIILCGETWRVLTHPLNATSCEHQCRLINPTKNPFFQFSPISLSFIFHFENARARECVSDGIIFNIFHYQMCLSHTYRARDRELIVSKLNSYYFFIHSARMEWRVEKAKNVKFILRLCLLLSVVCRWLSNSITEGELPVNNPAIWVLSKSSHTHTLCGSFSSVSVEEVWGILMTAHCSHGGWQNH